MGILVCLLFVYMSFTSRINGDQQQPHPPGYYLSEKIESIKFESAFINQWGPNHQVDEDGILTLILDKSYGGSGFKSLSSNYSSGYFGVAMKLQAGDYTAGVNTNLYLSNSEVHPGNHDEIDIEFLGHQAGAPYTLQTNVYIKGSGDGNIIGREMQFHLWFDPTQDFHNYAILWNPNEILFLVDDVLIRRYPNKNDNLFPQRPMTVYGSIWDASSWATENGKYKIDYRYQPFLGKYRDFKISDCSGDIATMCGHLSHNQRATMESMQKNYMVYNYCQDSRRNHDLTPECSD